MCFSTMFQTLFVALVFSWSTVAAASPGIVSPCGAAEAWAKTQRDADFKAYGAFYAADFRGTKKTKSGRETKFDRKRWLKDRKSMFRVGTAVYVTDCKVESQQGTLTNLIFNQYWRSASGKYADHGKKRLTLEHRNRHWQILAETMLTSTKWNGVFPAPAGAKVYTVRVSVDSYLKGEHDEPYTMMTLRHGYDGKIGHATRLIDAYGPVMAPPESGECVGSTLPGVCSTYYTDVSQGIRVRRKRNQLLFDNTESAGGAGSDGKTYYDKRYSLPIPKGVKLDFKFTGFEG